MQKQDEAKTNEMQWKRENFETVTGYSNSFLGFSANSKTSWLNPSPSVS